MEDLKAREYTYDCYQMTHVASDGSVDFLISRRFDDDGHVL